MTLPHNVRDDPDLRNRTGVFADRCDAGRLLGRRIGEDTEPDSVLLAIPSGGIPVGIELSKMLCLSMCLMPVRKLVIPGNPEAGFGAVSWDGDAVLNNPLVRAIGLSGDDVEKSIETARSLIDERMRKFDRARSLPSLSGRAAILVDDGLASGYTMLAGVRSARKRGADRVAVAVPTGSLTAVRKVASEVDRVYCLNIREGPIYAVADAYRRWHDICDEEAARMLDARSVL